MAKNKAYYDDLMGQISHLKSDAMDARENNVDRYQQSWLYYRMAKPEKDSRLVSTYVEPVMKEAVDKMMPPLLNIFTESDDSAVLFRSKGFRTDPRITNAINESINRIFLRENDGYSVLSNAFKESLISGDAFIKYYIEENHEEDTFKMDDWTDIRTLTDMFEEWPETTIPWDGVRRGAKRGLEWKTVKEVSGVSQNPVTGASTEEKTDVLYLKGKIDLYRIEKSLVVEQVDLKDLYFDDTHGHDFRRCRYLSQRMSITVGDCVNMGYDFEDFEDVSTINALADEPMSKQRLVNDRVLSADDTFDAGFTDPYERRVHLWEHYLYSSIPSGKTKLYQVVATDNTILSVEEVDRIPFVHGTFETLPGSFWGGSLYDICFPFQDEITRLKRLVHQNMANSSMGRYQAIKGQYDRESLLNNRPGSVVEVTQAGAVTPFMTPPMPNGIMDELQMTMQAKDNIISTSVGSTMTPDGLPQVAASTVAMVLSNEQLKDKVVAKNLARTLITPLYEGIYELMRSEKYRIFMEDGSTITADQFPSSYEFIIDINTQDDNAAQAAQIANVAQMMAQLSQVQSPLMTPQNLFEISQRMLKQVNIEDGDKYFTNPAAQQPDPQMLAKQQAQEALAEEAAKVQLEAAKAQVIYTTAQAAKIDFDMSEAAKNSSAKRQRDAEDSLRKFKEAETNGQAKLMDADSRHLNAVTNSKATDAEILGFETGNPVNITGTAAR